MSNLIFIDKTYNADSAWGTVSSGGKMSLSDTVYSPSNTTIDHWIIGIREAQAAYSSGNDNDRITYLEYGVENASVVNNALSFDAVLRMYSGDTNSRGLNKNNSLLSLSITLIYSENS